jgi:SAM-dependent methyltransferase
MDRNDVVDVWDSGSPYERYVGRWSRQVAPKFLARLRVPAGRRWLDVGCGTGALAAAITDRCFPASVAAVEPSAGFVETAKRNLSGNVRLHRGIATALPLADASVDVVVSGLVLNFVGDPRAALVEMARVSSNGGTIAAYVWDYSEGMELIRRFWDAAIELDPSAAALDEGVRFPLCRRGALDDLFVSAGLGDVEVAAIDVPTRFSNFNDYWDPFLGGQGPAPAYAMSLDETGRARLRDHVRQQLAVSPDGSISLIARAWTVRGTVAR